MVISMQISRFSWFSHLLSTTLLILNCPRPIAIYQLIFLSGCPRLGLFFPDLREQTTLCMYLHLPILQVLQSVDWQDEVRERGWFCLWSSGFFDGELAREWVAWGWDPFGYLVYFCPILWVLEDCECSRDSVWFCPFKQLWVRH